MELGNVPNIVIGLTADYSTDLNKWFDGILSGKYDVNANWTGYEALANPNNLPTCPKMKRDDYDTLQPSTPGDNRTEATKRHSSPDDTTDVSIHESKCSANKPSYNLWRGSTVSPIPTGVKNIKDPQERAETPAGVFEDIQDKLGSKCRYDVIPGEKGSLAQQLYNWVMSIKEAGVSPGILDKALSILGPVIGAGQDLPLADTRENPSQFKNLVTSLMAIGTAIRGVEGYAHHVNSLFLILLSTFSCYSSQLVACWGAYVKGVQMATGDKAAAAKTMITDCIECTVTSMATTQHARALGLAQREYILAVFVWNSAAPSQKQWVYPAVTPPTADSTTHVSKGSKNPMIIIDKYVSVLVKLLGHLDVVHENSAKKEKDPAVKTGPSIKTPELAPEIRRGGARTLTRKNRGGPMKMTRRKALNRVA